MLYRNWSGSWLLKTEPSILILPTMWNPPNGWEIGASGLSAPEINGDHAAQSEHIAAFSRQRHRSMFPAARRRCRARLQALPDVPSFGFIGQLHMGRAPLAGGK